MTPIPCPSCGAPIPFRTSFAVFAVCGYCGATVVRTDRDVSRIGQAADLPDEMTPIQVGTVVTAAGTPFTVAGRVRMSWEDGFWNEWFLAGDGPAGAGWLAEAQGTWAVSFPCPLEEAQGLNPDMPPALGDPVRIRGRAFRVSDVKAASCVGSEGELPFAAERGWTALYADMLSEDGGFAGAEYSDDGARLFLGQYVTFASLRPRNLRPVEGWTAPVST